MASKDFYTFRGYMQRDQELLTPSMEDYLEMIYRLCGKNGFTRVNEVAKSLNVQPPSATRMVQKLSELTLVGYEKYGIILLTEKGKKIGKMLLKRHHIIEAFLKLLTQREDVLEQTEKLEHSINTETLESLSIFMEYIKEHPELIVDFNVYSEKKRQENIVE